MDGTRPHQVQDQDQASFFVETKTVSSPPESRVLSSVCSLCTNACVMNTIIKQSCSSDYLETHINIVHTNIDTLA